MELLHLIQTLQEQNINMKVKFKVEGLNWFADMVNITEEFSNEDDESIEEPDTLILRFK